MKKIVGIIIILFAFMLPNPAQSQVEKGKFLLGASSDFTVLFNNSKSETILDGTTTESSDQGSTQFGLTPTVGYFLLDGFSAGLFMNLDISNLNYDYEMEDGSIENLGSNNTSFSIGPFVRYYIAMEKVKPFAQAKLGFGSSNLKYDMVDYDYTDPFNPKVIISERESKSNLSNWGIGAGAAFFITGNISVDVMLGYNSDKNTRKSEDNDMEYKTTTGGFGLNVGFNLVLP